MTQKKYEVLEHPTDYFVKVYGKDLKELFNNAASAMLNEMFDITLEFPNRADEISDEIFIGDNTVEDLLMGFLKEILFYIEKNNILPICILISFIYGEIYKDLSMAYKLVGVNINSEDGKIKEFIEPKSEIKAVTYHKYLVEFINDHWEATILFDL